MDGSGFDFGPDLHEVKTSRPLIIDSFAGGGGASTGIEAALGRSPDIAINHDGVALAMHEANHPETHHVHASVYSVDPADMIAPGQKVGLLWASPDCTHHSRAKGGKPLEAGIRDLAWVIIHYAERVSPEIIMLENVVEFADWGPLDDTNRPVKEKKGETFRVWVARLRKLGYAVEWRALRACDYGAPTIRKRLFLVARRDGKPIVWPKPTHAKRNDVRVAYRHLRPFRVAADVVDWSIPCPSIFDTSEEIMEKHGVRAIRPLADNTLKRIARGVMRYVIEAENPFIVVCNHGGDGFRGQGLDDPLATLTASRDAFGLVRPVVAPFASYAQQGGRSRSILDPLHTLTASKKDQNVLVAPSLVQTGYGERAGQAPRCLDIQSPLGTLMATGSKHAVVAPHLMTMRNSQKPFSAGDEPVHTLTAGGAHMMTVLAHLQSYYGEGEGGKDRSVAPDDPLTTLTTANRHAVVSAFMAQHNGGERMSGATGRSIEMPVSTLTTRATQQTIIAASMASLRGTTDAHLGGRPIDDPAATVAAGGQHAALIAAFLYKYYGTEQDPRIDDPLATLTTKERFGVVTVEIGGQEFAIVDIGMRMLTPREQFRAQGFPDNYVIDRDADGRVITKTAQTRLCGNSVCPHVAEALVAANCPHLMERINGK